MKTLKIMLAAGITSCMFTGAVQALDFDFSGNFTYDNDIARFNFTVGSASTVTVFSSSWDDGGFDPILSIWDASGSRMYQQDDGYVTGSTLSNGVSYNHGTWDSYYSVLLGAGDYIATVGQYSNFSKTASLADGFLYDDNPNFTYDFNYGGATQAYFNGVWTNPDPRTGSYAFHLLNVAAATHEEPNPVPDGGGSLVIFGIALTSLGAVRKFLCKA